MSPPSLLFAAAALLPAMTAPSEGAPQLSAAGALIVALCNGGAMVLPIPGGAPSPATAPCCCAKGCRSGKRKRIDREQ
jgi:hypothetical protein